MSPLANAPTLMLMTLCPALLSPPLSTACHHLPWLRLQQQQALMLSAASTAWTQRTAMFWLVPCQLDLAHPPLGHLSHQMMTLMPGHRSCGAFLTRSVTSRLCAFCQWSLSAIAKWQLQLFVNFHDSLLRMHTVYGWRRPICCHCLQFSVLGSANDRLC